MFEDSMMFDLLTRRTPDIESNSWREAIMLFYEEHWYDFIDLIAEPYRSMVILAIVVGIVVYVLVVIKRKKSSAGRNKANPGNYVSDEKFMSSLIAARRKREDSRYVGDGSTAIPKIADSGKTDESIWADEGK